MEGPHREIVGAAVVDGKLLCKVVQGVKAVAGIKAFLILAVAALYFAVVARGIGTDKFMPDSEAGSSCFEQGGKIPLAGGKAVGELKPVVGLDTLYPDAPAGIPLDQPFQEVGGRGSTLFGGRRPGSADG